MFYKKFRFRLFSMHLAILGLHFGRPKVLYTYNDGHSAFIDLGPVRLERNFWREKNFVWPHSRPTN